MVNFVGSEVFWDAALSGWEFYQLATRYHPQKVGRRGDRLFMYE